MVVEEEVLTLETSPNTWKVIDHRSLLPSRIKKKEMTPKKEDKTLMHLAPKSGVDDSSNSRDWGLSRLMGQWQALRPD